MIQEDTHIQDIFIKSSLFITKDSFYSLHKEFNCAGKLSVENIDLDYRSFKQRLHNIGSPWGWDRRPKYQDVNAMTERINSPQSKLYSLLLEGSEIGYCLTVPRDDLSATFKTGVGEIENFGIDIKHNAKGYGSPFFKYVCNKIFNQGFGVIYLSTRSTNHEKVLPFYEKLGMKIIKQVTKKDDLVTSPNQGIAFY